MGNRDRQRDSIAAERGHATAYLALETWRRELALQKRSETTLDALLRAACEEASAQEFEHIPRLHNRFMNGARRIIREAAKREAA